ncbi:hypothetical protein BCT58_08195 [Vibrio lentus]|nr:hypothetical protein BCT58_08195 [Vibrio lentus]
MVCIGCSNPSSHLEGVVELFLTMLPWLVLLAFIIGHFIEATKAHEKMCDECKKHSLSPSRIRVFFTFLAMSSLMMVTTFWR